ncbi:hypothetical protein Ga0466249_001600 [Sporomusaceae bacterium BoRhaA]|uniref:hypothetical protein n=1 Tax=Pelorhabdus rhamnosifermentans TaxID=2772457 RepID=UPI001C062B77|nr:hypothetical protein [Pelorhabdus rhamnosifermentans]MBU2700508.1 hypothetical protein [Pelorhabdus rhamnosifermentans]
MQKKLEQLDEYRNRLKKYNQYLHIAGDRNSFSKTDPDTTFMRMNGIFLLRQVAQPGRILLETKNMRIPIEMYLVT